MIRFFSLRKLEKIWSKAVVILISGALVCCLAACTTVSGSNNPDSQNGQNNGLSQTNHEPVWETVGETTVRVGTNLQLTVKAVDADGDRLTYSAANLPAGASFDPAIHTLTWTPQTAGSVSGVVFTVSDGKTSTSQTVNLTVERAEPNRAPILEKIENVSVIAGNPIEFTLKASDPDGDKLTFSALNLPEGASFDQKTGTFSWVPQTTSTFNVIFTVSDGEYTLSENIQVASNPDPGPDTSSQDDGVSYGDSGGGGDCGG